MNVDPELVAKISFWVGAFAGFAAGLAVGFWMLQVAQRAYIRKLEAWATLGAPTAKPAEVARPGPDFEDLAMAAGREGLYSEDTIARGVDQLLELARQEGRPLSREKRGPRSSGCCIRMRRSREFDQFPA